MRCRARILGKAAPNVASNGAVIDRDLVARHLACVGTMTTDDATRDIAVCNLDNIPIGLSLAHIVAAGNIPANDAVIDRDLIRRHFSCCRGGDDLTAAYILTDRAARNGDGVRHNIACRAAARNTSADQIVCGCLLEFQHIFRGIAHQGAAAESIMQHSRRSADINGIALYGSGALRRSAVRRSADRTARDGHFVARNIARALRTRTRSYDCAARHIIGHDTA